MYGFIYITTNNITGKKYIGKRKYTPGWENYLGSGIHLRNSLLKYGRTNFKKEIIDFAENEEELALKEKEWISKFNAIESSNFYNIAEGGIGGNTYIGKTEQEIKIIGKKISLSVKGKTGNSGEKNGMYGKKHTQETIDKISSSRAGKKVDDKQREALSERTRGSKNPMAKKVVILSENGESKEFGSLQECSQYLNLSIYLIKRIAESRSAYIGFKIEIK